MAVHPNSLANLRPEPPWGPGVSGNPAGHSRARREAKLREEGNPDGIGSEPTAADSFDRQWDYVTCEDPRIVLLNGRQSGKTTGHQLRAQRNVARGRRTLYVAMVRENAREQFFLPLMGQLMDRHWRLDETAVNLTSLTLRTVNGGLVKGWSADDVRDVGKARGYQWDDVIVDEAQSFPDDVLVPLLDLVIIPTLIKTGGSLVLSGTPPDTLAGYLVRAWESGKWRRFAWTIFDNPHIPQANVHAAYEARGIAPGHPIWEREVMGKLMANPEALVYPYAVERNGLDRAELTDVENRNVWRFALGLDLGFVDASAIVVVGWRHNDPERRLYVVHEWEQRKLDVDQLAVAFRQAYDRWRPGRVVGDHGGHAAQSVLETLSHRFNIRIERKPGDLVTSTQLLADDFRAGRLKAEPSSLVARDAALVIWAEQGGRMVPNAKGYHSDVVDALRYAHWGARHWASKAPPTTDQSPQATAEAAIMAQLAAEARGGRGVW